MEFVRVRARSATVGRALLNDRGSSDRIVSCCITADDWCWRSVDGTKEIPVDTKRFKELLSEKYDLCVTGEVSACLPPFSFFNS